MLDLPFVFSLERVFHNIGTIVNELQDRKEQGLELGQRRVLKMERIGDRTGERIGQLWNRQNWS
jgi:hypothetical protein